LVTLQKVLSMTPEFGNNYFVQFDDENIVTDAWAYVRQQNFKDKPVQARIKSENLSRNIYYDWNDPVPDEYTLYGGWQPYGRGRDRGYAPNRGQKPYRGKYTDRKGAAGNRRQKNGTTKPKQGQNGSQRSGPKHNHTVPIEPSHWPALPTREQETTKTNKAEVIRYNKTTIVAIIDGIREVKQPAWEVGNDFVSALSKEYEKKLEITETPEQDRTTIEWVPPRRASNNKPRKSSAAKQKENNNTNNNNDTTGQ